MRLLNISIVQTTMQTVTTKTNLGAGKDSWPFLGKIVLLLMMITFQAGICNADDKYMCNGAKYTRGSELESNLKRVLSNLAELTSKTGFNTSVQGQIPNQIYGLLQCSGNATVNQCYSCSRDITTNIRADCGTSVGGRVWYDLCYLRYENYSFIGQLDTYGWDMFNNQKVSNPDNFTAALGKLFNNLSAEISSGSASNRYASGSIIDSSFHRIFAQVQCWRDVSIDNCTKCLSHAIHSILKENDGRNEGQGFRGSCIARYESELFSNNSPSPSATETPRRPPSPAETPVPPPKPTTASASNNSLSQSKGA